MPTPSNPLASDADGAPLDALSPRASDGRLALPLSLSSTTIRCMLLTLLASAIALGVLLWFTSEDMPRADEWGTPGEYLRDRVNGTATFRTHLFRQHNESRVIFAQLLAAVIADHWGWNQHIFHALNWAITLLTAFLFVRLTAKLLPAGRRLPWPVQLILCSVVALVFTPVQWRNLLSSGQIITISIPCLLLAGISLNAEEKLPVWLRYAAAGLFSLLASFSFINGLMLWFLLWPAPFVMAREGRWRIRRSELLASVVYLAVALTVMAVYFADYHTPPGLPSLSHGLRVPHRSLFFALTWLTGPIFPEPLNFWMGKAHWIPYRVSMVLVGITGLLLLAVLSKIWRGFLSMEVLRRVFPFLPLLAYSLISAASISLARVALGLFGNVSRYSTVAIPAYLALAGILAVVMAGPLRTAGRRILPVFATVFAVTVLVASLIGGIGCLVDRQAARQAALSLAFRKLAPADPLFGNVFPVPGYVSPLADDLERQGLRRPSADWAWVSHTPPTPRADLVGRIDVVEENVVDVLVGQVLPAAGLEPGDVLVLREKESARPVTALLAPARGNYPGKPHGIFEVRYDRAFAGRLSLDGGELCLARPRTRELWRLARP